jgi:cell division topological specificity factor
MVDFFRRLFGGAAPNSGSLAANRLKVVLVHDRSNINPALMDELKDEIIAVIQRHVAIDPEGVEINLSQNGRESRLVADIPLMQGRQRKQKG